MARPLKVLFFIDRLRLGGIQMLAYNILKYNDASRMDIEILNLDDGEEYPLTRTLKEMGVTIHQLKGVWMWTPLDLPKYYRQVNRFFAEHHDYDVVHMHSSSKNYYILQCAAKWNIPVRVAHSHNTGFQTHNPLSIAIGNVMKWPMRKYANRWIGCSELACSWLFGETSIQEGKAEVLPNGIDSSGFIFDQEKRQKVRKELGIDDKFVIGHVGRFVRQKNHTFLLDIFYEISQKREDAVLMLIGIGELMDEMKQKAKDLGILDKILFMGFREDREVLMQAMDSFLFPSLYEGFSVVLIEAQTASLPVFTSDATTTETKFTDNIQFLSLESSAKDWADAVLNKGAIKRLDLNQQLIESGLEIHSMINHLYTIYTNYEDNACKPDDRRIGHLH